MDFLSWDGANKTTLQQQPQSFKFLISSSGFRMFVYGSANGTLVFMDMAGMHWTNQKPGWCSTGSGETLRIGDVNGDGLYDLLCHDSTGNTTVMMNQGGKLYL